MLLKFKLTCWKTQKLFLKIIDFKNFCQSNKYPHESKIFMLDCLVCDNNKSFEKSALTFLKS